MIDIIWLAPIITLSISLGCWVESRRTKLYKEASEELARQCELINKEYMTTSGELDQARRETISLCDFLCSVPGVDIEMQVAGENIIEHEAPDKLQ